MLSVAITIQCHIFSVFIWCHYILGVFKQNVFTLGVVAFSSWPTFARLVVKVFLSFLCSIKHVSLFSNHIIFFCVANTRLYKTFSKLSVSSVIMCNVRILSVTFSYFFLRVITQSVLKLDVFMLGAVALTSWPTYARLVVRVLSYLSCVPLNNH
jgi:hypothetical protein